MSTLKPGALLRGRYLLQDMIGQGSMATVFKAKDTVLFQRSVAVKVLDDNIWTARYQRELKALTAIRHPGVLVAHDWGIEEDGTTFAVYELLDQGEPLHSIVPKGGMEGHRVAGIAKLLGEALAEVHRQGIVHRDIFPLNIILRNVGTPHEAALLVDFGKAAITGETDDDRPYPPPDGYAAPEVLMGKPASKQSDIFSLAATLWYALTGAHPWKEDAERSQSPILPYRFKPWPRTHPVAARDALSKGLAPVPMERDSDARNLGLDVAAALEIGGFSTGQPPRPLRVFLCHASQDKPAVRKLHELLISHGIDAWLDEVKLLPGQDWKREIANAICTSDAIIICATQASVTREGFVQKELRWALDVGEEKPEGTIFLVPTKLEQCELPSRLLDRQWVDLFVDGGFDRLLEALRLRATGRATGGR